MTVRALGKELRAELSPFESENILMTVLGFSRTDLIIRADEEVDDDALTRIKDIKERRKTGEPLQYLLREWSFLGRVYEVGEGVLIPRDDTEVVVSEALSLIPKDQRMNILDLCSGSGIIAVTLKKERPLCRLTAVEKSEEAYAYLLKNTQRNDADIDCILSDLSDCAEKFSDGSLDLIVSNPPYIKTSDLPTLQREVLFEPMMALDGGESGYEFYEKIVSLYPKKLRKGGHLAFEIGEGQSGYISSLLTNAGFEDIRVSDDIQGIPRAIIAKKI